MTQGNLTHDRPARDAPPDGRDGVTPPAPLKLDPDKYRAHLEEFDLSEEQESELLAVLWDIMRSFVEIGFGLDSVQLFSTPDDEKARRDSGNGLEEKDHHLQHFNRTALPRAAQEDDDE